MRFAITAASIAAALSFGFGLASAASHIDFRGQRYTPTLGAMPASLGIGFDPVNNRVLSNTETDLCGGSVVNRAGNNGVSWDPVNEEFWMINMDREVYRFDAGDNPEVIFQIPQTFDVPGVGSQTLHSPQGLAVDMNHVYVVDFGPNAGQADSNQWFKFTRNGTAVSSSASTDFNARLQDHVDTFGDAVADGITWIPPGAPMDEGLFYVAVEHTGIMVLDEDGFFVDNFLWTENGLVYGENVPFAFAGITLDPATGDLYLVENGGALTHVWVRLPDGPQTIIHGVYSNFVLGPDTRCARPKLIPTQGTGNSFSLTYRSADGLLWTNDFNTGEVFTMDPLTGKAASVGFMGLNGVWGMAYDAERDVIYVCEGFPQRGLHVLDPTTLTTTLIDGGVCTVRELAFNSDDNCIYGVDTGPPAMLIRYDRDTGARTDVGLTVSVNGIAYDSVTGMLVGHDGNSALWNINPVNGQASGRAQLPVGGGWEGLAAIPVTSAATAVAPRGPMDPSGSLVLLAYPNPLNSSGHVSFELPRAAHVSAKVYDLAGRLVTTLFDGELPAGSGVLPWNGRDGQGRSVASGTYFLELRTPWNRGTTKVSVVK